MAEPSKEATRTSSYVPYGISEEDEKKCQEQEKAWEISSVATHIIAGTFLVGATIALGGWGFVLGGIAGTFTEVGTFLFQKENPSAVEIRNSIQTHGHNYESAQVKWQTDKEEKRSQAHLEDMNDPNYKSDEIEVSV